MRFILSGFLVVSLLLAGCDNQPVAIAPNPANGIAAANQDAPQKPAEQEGGIGKAVSDLVGKAKENAPTLDGARKWLNDAGDATGQTAEDTMEWINESYKSLSDQGLTTAKSAQEWVSQDWNAMGAWEYKVVNFTADGNSQTVEQTLNESGKSRWECFHVTTTPEGMRFFMKRQKSSYLKNVPLKDMLKLIPLLDGAEE